MALAELAEAAARLPHLRELATRAVGIVFADPDAGGVGGAIARWWLADRWRELTRVSVPVAPELPARSRLVALAAPEVAGARVAAIAIEVAGRAASDLLISTPEERAAAEAAAERRLRTEVVLWRWGAVGAVAFSIAANAPGVVMAIAGIGRRNPELGRDPSLLRGRTRRGRLCSLA